MLTKSHKVVVQKFMQYAQCNLVVEPSGGMDDNRLNAYVDFLEYVRANFFVTNESSGYEDSLRTPLQPLRDDLDSSTYEVMNLNMISNREY